MLSEERVKHMTKMALFEKKESRKIQPVMKYNKKDYMGLCVIVNIFLGTALYLMIIGIVVTALYSTVFTNLHLFGLVLGIVLGMLLYVVFIFFYLRAVRKRASKRYNEGLRVAKELRKDYHTLQKMYEEEESNKAPEGWY